MTKHYTLYPLGERVSATWRCLVEHMAAVSAAGYVSDELIEERAGRSNPWGIPAIYMRGPSA